MRVLLLLVFLATISTAASADTNKWEKALLMAIYDAEGGKHTNYPYGVKSVSCETNEECRQITLNSIRNNLWRYLEENGLEESFIAHMGKRWCPIGANDDPNNLNKNWKSNVIALYKENKQ